MTILYPKTFHESPPYNGDGIFEWDYIDAVTCKYGAMKNTIILQDGRTIEMGKGITGSDIDRCDELNGLFLTFETKNPGVNVPFGQQMRNNQLLATGLVTHLDIWGKKIPKEWRLRRWQREDLHGEGDDCRTEIAKYVEGWCRWAKNMTLGQVAHRALCAAWFRAPKDIRDQFAKDVLNPSLGILADTPLGIAAIERSAKLK
jgi:hypothetical protein